MTKYHIYQPNPRMWTICLYTAEVLLFNTTQSTKAGVDYAEILTPAHILTKQGECEYKNKSYRNLQIMFLRFATGTIARSYKPGQVIDIEIDLVANHQVDI